MIEAAILVGVLFGAAFVVRKMLRDAGAIGTSDWGCGKCGAKRRP